jgi:hypothetical protein
MAIDRPKFLNPVIMLECITNQETTELISMCMRHQDNCENSFQHNYWIQECPALFRDTYAYYIETTESSQNEILTMNLIQCGISAGGPPLERYRIESNSL